MTEPGWAKITRGTTVTPPHRLAPTPLDEELPTTPRRHHSSQPSTLFPPSSPHVRVLVFGPDSQSRTSSFVTRRSGSRYFTAPRPLSELVDSTMQAYKLRAPVHDVISEY